MTKIRYSHELGSEFKRNLYEFGLEVGIELQEYAYDLLPELRSGKPVHFLARDVTPLGEFFANHSYGSSNASVAWGLNRGTMGEYEVFADMVRNANIKIGDIVVDSGYSGTIPTKIDRILGGSGYWNENRNKHNRNENKIKSVLLEGSLSCFGRRARVVKIDGTVGKLESSPKMQGNQQGSYVCSTLDKKQQKEAHMFRLGLIAGLMNLYPRKIKARIDTREKLLPIIMKRHAENKDINRHASKGLKTLDYRASLHNKFAVVDNYWNDFDAQNRFQIIPAQNAKIIYDHFEKSMRVAREYKLFDTLEKAQLYVRLREFGQITREIKSRFDEYRKYEKYGGMWVFTGIDVLPAGKAAYLSYVSGKNRVEPTMNERFKLYSKREYAVRAMNSFQYKSLTGNFRRYAVKEWQYKHLAVREMYAVNDTQVFKKVVPQLPLWGKQPYAYKGFAPRALERKI